MSSSSTILHLPDTLANWPWPRAINLYYEEVKAESRAWFHSFKAFSAKSQYAFDKCDFEHLRTGSDLMNLLFAIDEYTDVEPAPVVRNMMDIVIDAMKDPHKPRPEGEVILGEIARQFWELAIKSATPTAQRHMIESLAINLDAVVQQADDRDNDSYRSIASYLANRRENIGAKPAYVPLELGLDLPDEVFYHPVIVELSDYVADLIGLDNDIASYNKEQATDDDRHNIVTVVMHELKVDLDAAMQWVLNYHRETEAKILDAIERVPSWRSDIDRQVRQYIDGLVHWPRGNDCWNFESGRYFGNKGPEIQKSRQVALLPKARISTKDGSLKREDVIVPLIESLGG
ncbi:terpenoid synthase [Fomitiporia mediterranea MF3/22]|uniref:terpenoid synthase n=1 Tax=Fomitiporia mediterranea (strain MF3/22) TaxID=694068 RepID=UPI0004409142|nr:terpenoid synthase [Fomitiporia mediterranea MF3/22]EJD00101.1 terpenoid synthase [Fomitiporia mediterranea MF3/22]